MMKTRLIRLLVLFIIGAFVFPASADIDHVQKWKRRAARLRMSCGNEVKKLCSTVPDGKEQFRCVFSNQPKLSPVCVSYVVSIRQKIALHKAKEMQQRMPASTPKKNTAI